MTPRSSKSRKQGLQWWKYFEEIIRGEEIFQSYEGSRVASIEYEGQGCEANSANITQFLSQTDQILQRGFVNSPRISKSAETNSKECALNRTHEGKEGVENMQQHCQDLARGPSLPTEGSSSCNVPIWLESLTEMNLNTFRKRKKKKLGQKHKTLDPRTFIRKSFRKKLLRFLKSEGKRFWGPVAATCAEWQPQPSAGEGAGADLTTNVVLRACGEVCSLQRNYSCTLLERHFKENPHCHLLPAVKVCRLRDSSVTDSTQKPGKETTLCPEAEIGDKLACTANLSAQFSSRTASSRIEGSGCGRQSVSLHSNETLWMESLWPASATGSSPRVGSAFRKETSKDMLSACALDPKDSASPRMERSLDLQEQIRVNVNNPSGPDFNSSYSSDVDGFREELNHLMTRPLHCAARRKLNRSDIKALSGYLKLSIKHNRSRLNRGSDSLEEVPTTQTSDAGEPMRMPAPEGMRPGWRTPRGAAPPGGQVREAGRRINRRHLFPGGGDAAAHKGESSKQGRPDHSVNMVGSVPRKRRRVSAGRGDACDEETCGVTSAAGAPSVGGPEADGWHVASESVVSSEEEEQESEYSCAWCGIHLESARAVDLHALAHVESDAEDEEAAAGRSPVSTPLADSSDALCEPAGAAPTSESPTCSSNSVTSRRSSTDSAPERGDSSDGIARPDSWQSGLVEGVLSSDGGVFPYCAPAKESLVDVGSELSVGGVDIPGVVDVVQVDVAGKIDTDKGHLNLVPGIFVADKVNEVPGMNIVDSVDVVLPVAAVAHQSRESVSVQTCPSCRRTLLSASQLRAHRLAEHAHACGVTCATCGYSAGSWGRLAGHHALAHALPRVPCGACGERFVTRDLLHVHTFHKHKEVNLTFECPACAMIFGSPASLTRHVRSEHSGQNLFTCYCGVTLASLVDLKMHVDVHVEAIYKLYCSVCFIWLPTIELLEAHVAWAHVGRLRHTCRVCPRKFQTLSSLHRHHVKHHPLDLSYRCSSGCETAFASPLKFFKHLSSASHMAKLLQFHYKCQKCELTSFDPFQIVDHEDTEHSNLLNVERVFELFSLLHGVTS